MKRPEPRLNREELENLIKSKDLSGKNLSGFDLSSRALQHINFNGANLQEAIFINARLGFNEGQKSSDAGFLTSFRGARLTKGMFFNAHANGVNFTEANLVQACLANANLKEANFTRANLTSANLRDADLDVADLRGANLTGANLVGANLSGAKIDGAIFVGIIQGAFDDLMKDTRSATPTKEQKFTELTKTILNLLNNDEDVDLSLKQKKQILGIDGESLAESLVFKYLESRSLQLKRILGGDEKLTQFKDELTKAAQSLLAESSRGEEERGAKRSRIIDGGFSSPSSGGLETSGGGFGATRLQDGRSQGDESAKSSGRQ
jgi:hypothetical protein